jgi:hypothetical protein
MLYHMALTPNTKAKRDMIIMLLDQDKKHNNHAAILVTFDLMAKHNDPVTTDLLEPLVGALESILKVTHRNAPQFYEDVFKLLVKNLSMVNSSEQHPLAIKIQNLALTLGFIHPTSYFYSNYWIDWWVDTIVKRFNHVQCPSWTPRLATAETFLDLNREDTNKPARSQKTLLSIPIQLFTSASKALQLAYLSALDNCKWTPKNPYIARTKPEFAVLYTMLQNWSAYGTPTEPVPTPRGGTVPTPNGPVPTHRGTVPAHNGPVPTPNRTGSDMLIEVSPSDK